MMIQRRPQQTPQDFKTRPASLIGLVQAYCAKYLGTPAYVLCEKYTLVPGIPFFTGEGNPTDECGQLLHSNHLAILCMIDYVTLKAYYYKNLGLENLKPVFMFRGLPGEFT